MGGYRPTLRRGHGDRRKTISISTGKMAESRQRGRLNGTGFSNEWSAVANIDGDCVRATIDGGSGRILDVDRT